MRYFFEKLIDILKEDFKESLDIFLLTSSSSTKIKITLIILSILFEDSFNIVINNLKDKLVEVFSMNKDS